MGCDVEARGFVFCIDTDWEDHFHSQRDGSVDQNRPNPQDREPTQLRGPACVAERRLMLYFVAIPESNVIQHQFECVIAGRGADFGASDGAEFNGLHHGCG